MDDHSYFIQKSLKDLMILSPVSLAKYFESRVFKPEWGVT